METKKVGDQAPDFSGINQNGEIVKLQDYKGKKLIIYFYPKDDTPGCTAESCDLRDNISILKKSGFEVLGVSADSELKHKKFIEKYSLPFPLIADTEKTILNAFGVWGLKKFLGKEYDGIHRTTFVIDENGIIERVFNKVITKAHSEQILATYK